MQIFEISLANGGAGVTMKIVLPESCGDWATPLLEGRTFLCALAGFGGSAVRHPLALACRSRRSVVTFEKEAQELLSQANAHRALSSSLAHG